MTFATPLAAAIAAAVAIPTLLILYFLKLRRRDLEVSTTLLWKKAIEDLQANAPFQKLRKNLLLFLQLLILAAAILALAQPQFKSTGVVGQKHVILIDRSASMSATDGDVEDGTTRLREAKRRAIELIEGLPEPGPFGGEGETAMVIAFASKAEVVQNFTGNKAVLREAIESITPAYEPSSLKQALQLTRAHAGTKKFEDQIQENVGFVPRAPSATMHIFSDGRIADIGSLDTTNEDVIEYYPIGTSDSPNIGIVSMASSRAFNNPRKLKIGVGLMSTDLQRRSVQVQVAIDGVARDVIDVSIPAAIMEQDASEGAPPTPPTPPTPAAASSDGATGPQRGADEASAPEGVLRPGGAWFDFEIDRVEGGIVTAQLRSHQPDALPADDTAYLVAPPAQRLSVLLVTPGNYFIEPALEGLSLTRLLRVSPAQFQTMVDGGRILDAALADFDVVILDRTLPDLAGSDGKRAPGVPPGRVLVLGAVPPGLGLEDRGPAGAAVLLTWEPDHPVMKYADPQNLQIAESRLVGIEEDTPALIEVVAEADNGPAVLEVSSARTRAIVVPFDPLKSTWPFSAGYPMFIATAVTYLADDGAAGLKEVITPGTTLSERLPLNASNVTLVLPDRRRVSLQPSPDGTVTYEPIEQTGIYTIEWTGAAASSDAVIDGRVRRYIASNLLDPDESTIGAESQLSLPHAVVAGNQPQETLMQRKLWPWMLLAALAIVMLEWFIYNRKVYV